MTDIVYVVGRDAAPLLRASLRTVARHARNVGRVIVAGYPPRWLSEEIVRVEVADAPGASKFANIAAALFAALERADVAGEFLLAHDDHFLAEPLDLDEQPPYHRGMDLPERGARRTFPDALYRRSMEWTRERCVAAGLPFRDCGEHCPQRLDARDAERVREIFGGVDFDLASAFLNVRAARDPSAPLVLREDVKAKCGEEPRASLGWFSVDDWWRDGQFYREWAAREISEPCIYERTD